LRRIRAALGQALEGAGSVLVIEGPAGIGKSRLLAEACALAEADGLQVLRARGGVLERDLAYGAVRLLLERPLAALGDAEREDVLSGAAALAAPALAAAGAEHTASPDRGFAVDHGLFWCVANLAERRPLLLALDDAHWFDAPSLRFVHYLARRVADLPLAMILATRLPPFAVTFISAFLCLSLVERGALDEAEAIVAASGCGPQLPEVLHMNHVFWARGRLRAAQGRYDEALDDLLEFGRRSDRVELHNPAIPWRADAALVHARLGRRDAAEQLADEYHELARAWNTPRTIGIAARTRGVLAGGDGGLLLLREAVDAQAASPARLEYARSLLELGAGLRRAGQRSDAIEPLRCAADLARPAARRSWRHVPARSWASPRGGAPPRVLRRRCADAQRAARGADGG